MAYLELISGLRNGESVALLWEDLAVESRILIANKQVGRVDGKLVVSVPKTQNSVRKLAIPQQVVDILVAEHDKRPDSPYIFMSPVIGTMYHPDAIGRITIREVQFFWHKI